MSKFILAQTVWLAWLLLVAPAPHGAQIASVTVGHSSFSGDYVPLWIGVEERLAKNMASI